MNRSFKPLLRQKLDAHPKNCPKIHFYDVLGFTFGFGLTWFILQQMG